MDVVLALLWANASNGPPLAFDKNTHTIQSTWWFQPIWEICLSNLIIFQGVRWSKKTSFKPPTSSNTCLATRPELVKNRDLCKPPVESEFLPSRKWFQPWNSSSLISFDQFINIGVRTPLGVQNLRFHMFLHLLLTPICQFPKVETIVSIKGLNHFINTSAFFVGTYRIMIGWYLLKNSAFWWKQRKLLFIKFPTLTSTKVASLTASPAMVTSPQKRLCSIWGWRWQQLFHDIWEMKKGPIVGPRVYRGLNRPWHKDPY